MFIPKKTSLSMMLVAVVALLFAFNSRAAASVVKTNSIPADDAISMVKMAEDKKCIPRSVCFNDSDCGSDGKTGECVGLFAGKCNCDACISEAPCSDDSACGGLKGACDNESGLCDCIKGFRESGYPTYGEALVKLCNVTSCQGPIDGDATTTNGDDNCSGLPCRSGRCHCRK